MGMKNLWSWCNDRQSDLISAKTLVMSMLFMPQPFLSNDLDTWTKPDAESVKYGDYSSTEEEEI